MIKKNVISLLDVETVKAMKKRPGMYISGNNFEGITCLFSYILKAVLRNSTEPISIEWIIEEDDSCSLNIIGDELDCLKEKLDNFTQLDSLNGNEYYPYYMFFLFMLRIEVLCECNGKQLRIKKEKDTLSYDYNEINKPNKCMISFVLDNTIFTEYAFFYEPIIDYVQLYAYQYPNLTMIIKDERELKQLNTFHYPNGLQDKLNYFNHLKFGTNQLLWEEQHNCIIEDCSLKICFCIADHVYLHGPRCVIYAEDDLILPYDETIKNAVIEAMKQSMEEFSEMNQLELVFKESQLDYLTDFVASIYGKELIFGGEWKTSLDMPELKESLRRHMKLYFDNLFSSDKKYVEIINKIGFKKGNTLFLDAVFS